MTQKLHELHKGLIWEKSSTYVEFILDELKCREKIPNLKPTPENVKEALEFKSTIDEKIKNNEFDYKLEFPKSKYWKILERVKVLKNIEIHRNSIRLTFKFLGKRRREPLKNLEVTLANLNYAESKLHNINFEISANKFDYQEHFPFSKVPVSLGLKTSVPTVKEASITYLKAKEIEGIKDLKKYKGYFDNHILPKFGQRKLNTILPSEIELWQNGELTKKLTPKSIRNTLIPLKGIFSMAMKDRVIDFNPYEHTKKILVESVNKADPFSQDELALIEAKNTFYESEKNGFLFACSSGLRLSEWLALSWDDVDFINRTVNVKRAIVDYRYSMPKNKGSYRTVDLLDQAFDLLKRQFEITKELEPIKIRKLDWNRKTYLEEAIRPVFINTNTFEPYKNGNNINKKFFVTFLTDCKLRYRGINQARHTYGSQMITKGIAERWIANQMGHTDTAMLQKHYGKWMKVEIPDMAQKVSNLFK